MHGKTRIRLLAAALAAAILALPAAAEELTVRLDPEKTRVSFTLGATLHSVKGAARLASGEVRFDPESGEASGRVVVDAKSADTGNDGRDADMHGKVLESGRFPEVVLAVERVEGRFEREGTSRLTLHGQLSIHGKSHPVSLAAEVTAKGREVEARLAFAVPYVAWGLKDPSKFMLSVAKEVRVAVDAVGTLE